MAKATPGCPGPGERTSYDLLSVLARVFADLRRVALPRIVQLATGASARVGRLARGLGHAVWHERARIGAVSTRVLWWAALVLLLLVGGDLLAGKAGGPWLDAAVAWFAAGAGACVLVTVAARPRHLRIAGAMLGAGHGAFALLSYLTTATLS